MNSTSITDYILKLEKLCDEQAEQARTLIFNEIALKKKLREANEEKVNALNALNDLEYKNRSLFETTARVGGKTPYCKRLVNIGIVERLVELGKMTSDFHKTATYQNAATTVADLSYPVENGESLMHLQGIGSGIAAKINEYLDELDTDYEESECSDSESIASNGDDEESEDEESEDEESEDEESEDEEDYFISQNAGLAGMLYKLESLSLRRLTITSTSITRHSLSVSSDLVTMRKPSTNLKPIGMQRIRSVYSPLKFHVVMM